MTHIARHYSPLHILFSSTCLYCESIDKQLKILLLALKEEPQVFHCSGFVHLTICFRLALDFIKYLCHVLRMNIKLTEDVCYICLAFSDCLQLSFDQALSNDLLMLEVAQNVANLDGLAKVLASGAKASVTEKDILNRAR